jgi:predicted TIM-barrel fold metal-dependent hydrolase
VTAIDVHVHPTTPEVAHHYPDWFWKTPRERFGMETHEFTLDDLLRDMDFAEVERSVLLGFDCTTSYGWKIPNEAIAELVARQPDRLTGFASVDPQQGDQAARDLEFAVRELEMKGLKLHPPTQHFYPDDPKAEPVWAKAEELRIPVLLHVGQTFAGGYVKYAHPINVDAVAADHPDLVILLAHFGFPWTEEVISLAWTRPNVWIELSGWLPRYIPPNIWRFCRSMFSDRTVFGTDYPGIKPQQWIADFEQIELPDEVKEKVLHKNARRLIAA